MKLSSQTPAHVVTPRADPPESSEAATLAVKCVLSTERVWQGAWTLEPVTTSL